jgi:hypothetical protein
MGADKRRRVKWSGQPGLPARQYQALETSVGCSAPDTFGVTLSVDL